MGLCHAAAQRLPCWTSDCWARGGFDQIKESSHPGNFIAKARLVLLFPRVLGAAGARCGHRSSRSAEDQLCIPICPKAGMPSASPSAPKAVKWADGKNSNAFWAVVSLQHLSCESVLPVMNRCLWSEVNLQQHSLPFSPRHLSANWLPPQQEGVGRVFRMNGLK